MLIFVDESGYPHPNDSTTNPVLIGVCVYENDIKQIFNDIYKLKNSIFGKQDEIKATNLLRRQTITKVRTNNKEYVDQFINIACTYDIKVFAIIMEKPDIPIEVDTGLLPKQYYYLLKRVELYCTDKSKGIFIFDETNEGQDTKIAVSFNNFLFKSALGKSFENILELPLFVSSSITPGIQIADIFAGVIRHYYECCLDKNDAHDEFEIWIKELFNKINIRTQDLIEKQTGYKEYGFFRLNKSNYYYK